MNDRDTFLQNVEASQGVIRRLCLIYRDSAHDREDLFQEILVQLWKSWPRYRGDSEFSTWLYRIALSTAVASYRSPRRRFWQKRQPIEVDPIQRSNDSEALCEERTQLLMAISKLSAVEKSFVALFLDGFDHTQISQVLGMTPSAARVRLYRIKERLKSLTQEETQ